MKKNENRTLRFDRERTLKYFHIIPTCKHRGQGDQNSSISKHGLFTRKWRPGCSVITVHSQYNPVAVPLSEAIPVDGVESELLGHEKEPLPVPTT